VRLLTHRRLTESARERLKYLPFAELRVLSAGDIVRESPLRAAGSLGLSVEAQCQLLCCLGRCETRAPVYHRKKTKHLPFENFRRSGFVLWGRMATRTVVSNGNGPNNKPDLANKNKRMAYNMYRGMLTQFNAQANSIIENLPPERVTFDQGVERQILGMM
jgi:hypothetical protein